MARIDPGNVTRTVASSDARPDAEVPDTSPPPPPPPASTSAPHTDVGTAINQARDAATRAVALKGAVKDGFEAAKKVQQRGLKTAYAEARQRLVQNAEGVNEHVTKVGAAMKGMTLLGTAVALYHLPGKALTLAHDVRKAQRTGDSQDWNRAFGDFATTGKMAAIAVRGGLETTRDFAKGLRTYRAAAAAFRAEAPRAVDGVVRAAARKAMIQAFAGTARAAAKVAVVDRALEAARATGALKTAAGLAERASAKAALRAGGKAAAEAALEAGARSAAGPIAKAAGRFVPGLNIAIAAFDTVNAASALHDHQASLGRKVTACITAVGSIFAATDFPIASQIGAAVSTVSSLIGGYFFTT